MISQKEKKLTINRIKKLLIKYEDSKNFSYFTKEQREKNIKILKEQLGEKNDNKNI